MPGAGAGFVGVDVFFVLSGFLITGLLIEDRERSGRIRLGAFYARRIRRIVPAAVVVLASTLLAAELLLSPLDVPRVADDGLAAILSLSNVRFALDATDYFAATGASPLLHYWSLAVEEQFYLLWPLLLLVVARLGRPRVSMTVLALAVLIGSFVLSVAVTSASGPWAYYSLPTRAWELAAGGLLALAAPWYGWLRGRAAAATGWAGVSLIVVGLATIDATTAYPGVAAMLPTLGAVAIIASGAGAGSPGAIVLGLTPLRWLGRISYSLYLWHWPILVLGPVALGLEATEDGASGPDLPVRLGLVALAVAAATLTWWFVEQPFRRARMAPVRGRRGFALAGAMALTVVMGSTTMGVAAAREVDAAYDLDPVSVLEEDGEALSPLPTDNAPTDSVDVDDPDTETASPSTLPVPDPTAGASQAPATSADPTARPRPKARNEGPVPRDLDPSLGKARTDEDRLAAKGCGLALGGSRPPKCVFGDPDGDLTVALVGDSHAAQWFPAFNVLAKRNGWRLVPMTKFSCAFVDLPIWSDYLKREYTECEDWRENVVDRLVDLKPDLVVIASARWFPVVDLADEDPGRQGAGMARLIKRIPGTVAIMMDTPRSAYDVPACLAKHRDAIEACATSRAAAFGWRHRRREKAAAKLSGASLVDLSKATCPDDPCPPIIGRTLVYRDHHHMTASFVVTLVDDIEAALPDFGRGS
jgi:peptidoglycan/LPS O-acetylase OafA/YrhL